ncbi:MAG: RHS repeat-associated core domain-containing protein [Terriglobales bacterium]
MTTSDSATTALDANGNTLSDSSGKQYSWDFENRLTQAIVPGTGTTTFRYDPFGRRIQKSGPLGTTNYLYDGKVLLETIDQNGSILARYTQGANVDEPLAEVGSGGVDFYQQDGLASVTSLSNSSGTLANTYTFDAFGKLTASTGTLANPFQYTGRESDQETGLYYYRARFYDSSVGRFITEDPIGFRAGIDFYRYVRNNPVDMIDPTGLCEHCSIVVRCHAPSNITFLGWLGYAHCESAVVDANGVTHYLHAGPDPRYDSDLWTLAFGDSAVLNAWDNTSRDFHGNVDYSNPNASCDTVDCLIKQTNAETNYPVHFAYGLFGPNSNTMLNNTFLSCGINLGLTWSGN